MSDSPEAIRADIDRTRAELGEDVDALADKVSPSKAVHRQTDKVKNAIGSVRDRVMGVADDARETVAAAGSAASGSVSGAAHDAARSARGNPLAVGLIAFGAGLLAASLIPASTPERKAAAAAKEKAEPLVSEAKDVAAQLGDDLAEPAKEAASAVKDAAAGAVETVKEEVGGAASEVKDQAQQARDDVTGS